MKNTLFLDIMATFCLLMVFMFAADADIDQKFNPWRLKNNPTLVESILEGISLPEKTELEIEEYFKMNFEKSDGKKF